MTVPCGTGCDGALASRDEEGDNLRDAGGCAAAGSRAGDRLPEAREWLTLMMILIGAAGTCLPPHWIPAFWRGMKRFQATRGLSGRDGDSGLDLWMRPGVRPSSLQRQWRRGVSLMLDAQMHRQ